MASTQKCLADLTLRMDQMAANAPSPPTCSTRIGGETSSTKHHVVFQDTLEDETTCEPTPTSPTTLADSRRENGGIRGSGEGGKPQSQRSNSGEESKVFAPTNPTRSRSSEGPRDVGQIVRKWGVQYSGEQDQSAVSFLSRVEECRALTRLSEEEMLSSLSELFTGVAAMWYRNTKATWSTWEGFREEFLYWYGPHKGYQERLREEAKRRTQGPGESVREYVTCLLTILKRIEPMPSEEDQVERLYKNLRPELKQMVRRQDCSNVKGFLYLAVESELTLAEGYEPPPPLEKSIMPEAAFAPKNGRKQKVKLAAIEAASPSTSPSRQGSSAIEDLVARCTQLLEEAMKSRSPKSERSASAAPKASRQRSFSRGPGKNSPRSKSKPGRSRGRSPTKKGEKSASTSGGSSSRYPLGPLTCSDCGLLGYSRRYCPTCSGNEPKGAA